MIRSEGLTDYGVILVTVDTQEAAQAIAQALVSDRLAACVNMFPMHSVYRWENQVQQAGEWQLVIKTDLALFDAIAAALDTLHPYEVPEILALPIQQGSEPYLTWLADSVRT
jgi:periplasmic divalent cation tolerance protein